MKLSIIETGKFKLDGGAMFGVVPKTMWQKLNPPDENNMCTWAMRCLLVETGERKILVDTGMGNKQGEKFRSHFHPHGEDDLISSLKKKGLAPSDITDVLLTHLHFDHSGGAVTRLENGELVPTFPNAKYWTNRSHFEWASTPNPRERASFLKENFQPLWDQDHLHFISEEAGFEWLPNIESHLAFGHTEAMITPHFKIAGKTLVYGADLLPSSFHIGLPYVMSYDVRPFETMKEKGELLKRMVSEDMYVIFEHDPFSECGQIGINDRGRYYIKERMKLDDIL